MTDRRTDPSLQDLNRGMVVAAAALVVAGGVLGATSWPSVLPRWCLPVEPGVDKQT